MAPASPRPQNVGHRKTIIGPGLSRRPLALPHEHARTRVQRGAFSTTARRRVVGIRPDNKLKVKHYVSQQIYQISTTKQRVLESSDHNVELDIVKKNSNYFSREDRSRGPHNHVSTSRVLISFPSIWATTGTPCISCERSQCSANQRCWERRFRLPASPSSSHHHQRFGTLIGVFTFPTSFPASFPGSDAVSCLQTAPARATTGFCSASLRAALAGGSLLALRRRALDSLRAHPALIPSSRLSAPAAAPCVGDRQCH